MKIDSGKCAGCGNCVPFCTMGVIRAPVNMAKIENMAMRRVDPEQGAYLLAKPCECGAFNPIRARQVLEALRMKG